MEQTIMIFAGLLTGVVVSLWCAWPAIMSRYLGRKIKHHPDNRFIDIARGKYLNRHAIIYGTKRRFLESDRKLRKRLINLIKLKP